MYFWSRNYDVSNNPRADARELFKRMVFNALISNTDDHPRNHAVIAPGNDWRLSPVYDLVPLPAVRVERRDLALTVGDFGRYANVTNLMSQCTRFLLTRDEASQMIDEMDQHIRAHWYAVARSVGVIERDCKAIARAFAYEGLRLEAR